VPQLISTGKVQQVGLGVQIDPSQRLERRARIRGVVVLRVIPDSPAEKAGLKGVAQTARGISLGDVIIEINTTPIDDYDDLYNTLDKLHPGDQATVVVLRDGERVTVKVPLVVLD
jgi:S1-C subfamily serine protease